MSRLAPAGALLAVGIASAAGIAPSLRVQHVAGAQSLSIASTYATVVSQPDPYWLEDPPRVRHHASASIAPAPQPNVVASRKAIAKAQAPAPPRAVVVGTGQWALINQDRAAAGLAPLQWSPCLAAVATQNAQRMAAQGYISHAGGRIQDLACHLGSQTGENIGYTGSSPNDTWMNSWFMGDAPHRANILGPYHYVGTAWVIGPTGAYLAVEFG